jgi:hypothetical protein
MKQVELAPWGTDSRERCPSEQMFPKITSKMVDSIPLNGRIRLDLLSSEHGECDKFGSNS